MCCPSLEPVTTLAVWNVSALTASRWPERTWADQNGPYHTALSSRAVTWMTRGVERGFVRQAASSSIVAASIEDPQSRRGVSAEMASTRAPSGLKEGSWSRSGPAEDGETARAWHRSQERTVPSPGAVTTPDCPRSRTRRRSRSPLWPRKTEKRWSAASRNLPSHIGSMSSPTAAFDTPYRRIVSSQETQLSRMGEIPDSTWCPRNLWQSGAIREAGYSGRTS